MDTSDWYVRCTVIGCIPHWARGRACRRDSHEIWPVSVNDGAESQSVSKGGGHVGDIHVAIAHGGSPTPLLERLHPTAPSHVERAGFFSSSSRIARGRSYSE